MVEQQSVLHLEVRARRGVSRQMRAGVWLHRLRQKAQKAPRTPPGNAHDAHDYWRKRIARRVGRDDNAVPKRVEPKHSLL